MKCIIKYIFLFAIILQPFSVQAEESEEDTDRPVQSALMLQLGQGKVRDTYLAPLLYTGSSIGVRYERWRMMRSNRWYNEQIADATWLMADSKGEHSTTWSGRAEYRYAMHRGWTLDDKLSLFAGPYASGAVGFEYNLKLANANNPVSMRLAGNIGASALAKYKYNLFHKPCEAQLQLQFPLIGAAFMPEFGESYYEAFMVNDDRHAHFTSLHNQQDADIRLVTDIPLKTIPWLKKLDTVIRLGAAYHIETMKINDITQRFSTMEFVVGWTWKYKPVKF